MLPFEFKIYGSIFVHVGPDQLILHHEFIRMTHILWVYICVGVSVCCNVGSFVSMRQVHKSSIIKEDWWLSPNGRVVENMDSDFQWDLISNLHWIEGHRTNCATCHWIGKQIEFHAFTKWFILTHFLNKTGRIGLIQYEMDVFSFSDKCNYFFICQIYWNNLQQHMNSNSINGSV